MRDAHLSPASTNDAVRLLEGNNAATPNGPLGKLAKGNKSCSGGGGIRTPSAATDKPLPARSLSPIFAVILYV
jgi:hypothetical protein